MRRRACACPRGGRLRRRWRCRWRASAPVTGLLECPLPILQCFSKICQQVVRTLVTGRTHSTAGRHTSEPAAFRPCSSSTAFVIAPSTFSGSLTFTAHQHSACRLVWHRLPAYVSWYSACAWLVTNIMGGPTNIYQAAPSNTWSTKRLRAPPVLVDYSQLTKE